MPQKKINCFVCQVALRTFTTVYCVSCKHRFCSVHAMHDESVSPPVVSRRSLPGGYCLSCLPSSSSSSSSLSVVAEPFVPFHERLFDRAWTANYVTHDLSHPYEVDVCDILRDAASVEMHLITTLSPDSLDYYRGKILLCNCDCALCPAQVISWHANRPFSSDEIENPGQFIPTYCTNLPPFVSLEECREYLKKDEMMSDSRC